MEAAPYICELWLSISGIVLAGGVVVWRPVLRITAATFLIITPLHSGEARRLFASYDSKASWLVVIDPLHCQPDDNKGLRCQKKLCNVKDPN